MSRETAGGGNRTDAVIIAVILVASVGLGFVNEYRAERAAQALHTRIRHVVVVRRDGVRMVKVDGLAHPSCAAVGGGSGTG